MKIVATLATLPLLLAFALQPALAQDDHAAMHAQDDHAQHDHGHAAAHEIGEMPTGGWATDAPLREGMARIMDSVESLSHYEMGHLTAEQALGMAAAIEKDVGFLIANCKLDPDADAVLHGIIADLMKGTAELKKDPTDMAALTPMRKAVADYVLKFDDVEARKAAAAH